MKKSFNKKSIDYQGLYQKNTNNIKNLRIFKARQFHKIKIKNKMKQRFLLKAQIA